LVTEWSGWHSDAFKLAVVTKHAIVLHPYRRLQGTLHIWRLGFHNKAS
jgi:hypothetical protein